MSNNINTFWSFLNEMPVEIPIIQRDYAQGREGKESLRNSFLLNLKQALDHKLPNDEKTLKLDFVYGSLEDNRLNPLDGQQRLTTLWLLHWYIALQAGELSSAQAVLRKFGYETRLSSRDFCHELCDVQNFQNYKGGSVVSYIVKQTWFYSSWKQDPTIQSMLRMIKGTKKNDKNGIDIIDGLEELFVSSDKSQFVQYWSELISANAPIIFYHLPLHDFGLSDDLYVKMNARGKQLTSFENFKADLIGFIEQRSKEDAKWKVFLDARNGIPIKLDNKWCDIFWKIRSKGILSKNKEGNSIVVKSHKIDEVFFTFFNRFFWNELFIAKSERGYILDIGKGDDNSTEENNNASYSYLNDSKNKNTFDRRIAYDGFDVYKYYRVDQSGSIPYLFFERLDKVLTNYYEFTQANVDIDIESLLPCSWDKDFLFIPHYTEQNGYNEEIENNKGEMILKVSTLNQIERIVFFSVSKYFAEGPADVESLKRWMRVVWNLVSGESEEGKDEIRNTSAIRNAIEFIDSLDSHDVYNSLVNHKPITRDHAFDQRCKEEIEKAEFINRFPDWEEKIVQAENYSFCKGSIRFLFHNERGEIDWSQFDLKYKYFKEFFKPSCGKNESALASEQEEAKLLKRLISWFSPLDFWTVLNWSHRTFNNYPASWKYYLLNSTIAGPVHNLLSGMDAFQLEDCKDDEAKHRLYQLSQTALLDYVTKQIPSSWIRGYHGHTAIFPSGTGIFLNADLRDAFLLHTEGVSVHKKEHIVGESEFLFGSDIDFSFENCNFRWSRDNKVYLMQEQFFWEYANNKNADTQGNNKIYTDINTKGMDTPSIRRALHNLKEEYHNSMTDEQ